MKGDWSEENEHNELMDKIGREREEHIRMLEDENRVYTNHLLWGTSPKTVEEAVVRKNESIREAMKEKIMKEEKIFEEEYQKAKVNIKNHRNSWAVEGAGVSEPGSGEAFISQQLKGTGIEDYKVMYINPISEIYGKITTTNIPSGYTGQSGTIGVTGYTGQLGTIGVSGYNPSTGQTVPTYIGKEEMKRALDSKDIYNLSNQQIKDTIDKTIKKNQKVNAPGIEPGIEPGYFNRYALPTDVTSIPTPKGYKSFSLGNDEESDVEARNKAGDKSFKHVDPVRQVHNRDEVEFMENIMNIE